MKLSPARLIHSVILGFAAACLLLPAHGQSVPARPVAATSVASTETVGPIVLRDESIDQVLALLERLTGKTIFRPQALPTATITVNLRETVTRDEAIRAIETLLNLNGVAVTPLGDRFLKVVALNAAKSEAPELLEGSTLSLPPSGRLASKVFQLNFLRIAEFMPQITQLLSANTGSPPIIFEKANAALVTDTISNLQRVETLVSRLDQPALAGLTPKFYSLRFAKASDVVTKMRTILSGALQNQLGTATSYNPDDRTNQIVVISDPRQFPFFDELIAKLDVKADPNTRNEVIHLKHATAKDVASILSQLVTGQNNAAKSAEGATRPTSGAVATTPAVSLPNAAPAPTPTVATTASATLALDPSNQFSTLLTILSDDRSNSIVVSGTVDDIRLINDLVAKIDVLLAQVRIEVVIAEVTLTDAATSGISALGLKITGDKLVGGSFTMAGAASSAVTATEQPTGDLDLAAEIGLSTTPRKNIATILSQPNILTTHNTEGRIFVGEERPVISSYINDSSSTTTTSSGYRSTISSKEIGIELKVKPLIGNDGSVQLEITQVVDDLLGEVEIDGNNQPIVGSRETTSFVSARSGEIVVLGGLQRTSKSKNTNRLGPIPFLGDLLGTRTRTDTRTDLVFFLRPYVLTNTAADNTAALKSIDALPAKQRDPIRDALGQPLPDPKKASRAK